eukprot:jgi/Picsp_1/1508/NSC_04986-R1_prematurely terminated mrna decay factor-like
MDVSGEGKYLVCTYTKDVHKKKSKRWLDGKLRVQATRRGQLCDEEGHVLTEDSIPVIVDLEKGGGDAFVMSQAYLVQLDEVVLHGSSPEVQTNHHRHLVGGILGRAALSMGVKDKYVDGTGSRGFVRATHVKNEMQDNEPLGGNSVRQACGRNTSSVSHDCEKRENKVKPGLAEGENEREGKACGQDGNGGWRVGKKRRTTAQLIDILGLGGLQDGKEEGPAAGTGGGTTGEEKHELLSKYSTQEIGIQDAMEAPLKTLNGGKWNKEYGAYKPVKIMGKQSEVAFHGVGKVQSPVHDMIGCPGPNECMNPARRKLIPDSFNSQKEYFWVMRCAMYEELGLKLIDSVFKAFYKALDSCAKLNEVLEVQKIAKSVKVPYHGQCQLKIYKNNRNQSVNNNRSRKNKNDDCDDYCDDGQQKKEEKAFLILGASRMKSNGYHKNDVWILSNVPYFLYVRQGFVSSTVSTKPWACLVRSLWHGPNQDGKFEVEFISEKPPHIGKTTNVYAIQGPEASIELGMIDLLQNDQEQVPLLPSLLGLQQQPFQDNQQDSIWALPKITSLLSSLNDDQRLVLKHVASWNQERSKSPVCLVHGPFGTGKSQLLVSALHLLLSLRAQDQVGGKLHRARVLVCSHTNIAVDRVLLGLMESGITSFLRVGPLRRIHHQLLPFSLHASDSKVHASAISELKDMAKSATGERLRELQKEIEEAEKGSERKRKKMLKTTPIIGVTCISTALSVLEDQFFDVLILDEASQMTEPLSLAPIVRSKCKYIIAAGDPCQLPPVVCSPERVQGGGEGLMRPLFVRLASLGHPPYLLKTQYRCHPEISHISNTFFYDNKLLNGISSDDRPPLAKNLGAVSVIDVQGHESYKNKSILNETEARCVGATVKTLVQHGIPGSNIGVICFYREHVGAVSRCINALCSAGGEELTGLESIQVATVDSFQGAERNIIILSTATTNSASNFAADACRLNVALTRARSHLLVMGNMHALVKGIPAFCYIVSQSKSNGRYYMGGLPTSCLQ